MQSTEIAAIVKTVLLGEPRQCGYRNVLLLPDMDIFI